MVRPSEPAIGRIRGLASLRAPVVGNHPACSAVIASCMNDWIGPVIREHSYPGIVFLMLVENVFPPIPSELIMPLAGFFSARGDLLLPGVIAAGTLGSVLGALPLYYAGRAAGQERLRRWCQRYGKWIGLNARDIDRSVVWFERHGAKTVLLCRLIPGIRSLISIPAGIARMNLGRFLTYTTLGSLGWSTLLAVAGRTLGQNYHQVEQVVGPVSIAVIVSLVVLILIRAVRLHRRERSA